MFDSNIEACGPGHWSGVEEVMSFTCPISVLNPVLYLIFADRKKVLSWCDYIVTANTAQLIIVDRDE